MTFKTLENRTNILNLLSRRIMNLANGEVVGLMQIGFPEVHVRLRYLVC